MVIIASGDYTKVSEHNTMSVNLTAQNWLKDRNSGDIMETINNDTVNSILINLSYIKL
jgi:hypothetical protein